MENSDKGVKVVGFWVSLFTQRVRWALKIKGIAYDYIEEDINNKSPLLSELNPVYGKVPILLHDGNPLLDSPIIVEYIDEIWSHDPLLLPRDPHERAQARFWAKFTDEKVFLTAALALCTEGENQERAVKLAIGFLQKIEEKLKGKRFFGGDTIGYLDFMIGFVAYMLPVWEEVASVKILDPLRFPAIAAWTNDFLDHPVVKSEYLPPKAEMRSYYECRRKELIPVYASNAKKILRNLTE